MSLSRRDADADRKRNALAAFVRHKADIDALVARLAAASADHFNVDPDDVHWGDVGDLEHTANLLKQIVDFAVGDE